MKSNNSMPRISIFIPVYKESKLLPAVLQNLTMQHIPKEIFVILEEPTPKSFSLLKKFVGRVKFIVNEERKGKVNALNQAVKLSSGEIFLFLDDDVELPDEPNFLNTLIEEIKDIEILDIKKEATRDSFLSRIRYYEYTGFAIVAWLFSKIMKRCPAINGAAFAIKRRAFELLGGFDRIAGEDLHIATRAFLKKHRFKYTGKIQVYNHIDSDWKSWFIQRRRWVIGDALWFKKWGIEILKSTVINPQMFIPGFFLLFPATIPLILFLSIPDLLVHKLLSVSVLFFAVKFNLLLPVLTATSFVIYAFKSLFIILLSFLGFSALFFGFSKKLEFQFKIHEFFIFYFFYSFLCLLFLIVGLIQVFIFRKKSFAGWKV